MSVASRLARFFRRSAATLDPEESDVRVVVPEDRQAFGRPVEHAAEQKTKGAGQSSAEAEEIERGHRGV